MAKDIFRRYIWLVDVIRRAKDGITFEQINEKWKRSSLNDTGEDLPKRTFRNWISALPESVGVLVECENKFPYKYHITSGDLDNDELMDWTLNAFSIGNIMTENRMIHSRIMVEDIPSANETLEIICSAMRNNHEIWMRYQPFDVDYDYAFETKPYALKLSGRRWYLIAHSDKHDSEFCYGLDRIIAIRELDKPFKMDKDFSVKKQYANCIGVHRNADKPVETIRIKVTGYLRDYVETLPLHASQEIEEKTADYTLFKYKLVQNYELQDAILGLGECCEVLEPLSLRQLICERAAKIIENNK